MTPRRWRGVTSLRSVASAVRRHGECTDVRAFAVCRRHRAGGASWN